LSNGITYNHLITLKVLCKPKHLQYSWNEYGFDGGFVIDIKEKYQIDFSYIVNLYEGTDYNWLNVGFSAIINPKKEKSN